MCNLCDTASGYLLTTLTGQCLLCSTVTGATGVAILNGCVCNSDLWWNSITLTCDAVTCPAGIIYNAAIAACACDPVRSILVGSTCTSCSSISNSIGYSLTTTSCGCIPPNIWYATATGGICNICNSAIQIVLSSDGSCFTCPATNGGTGASNGGACTCSANYIWVPTSTGGSCTCDFSKAYLSGSTCAACSTGTSGADGKGGCLCSQTSVWLSTSCVLCKVSADYVLLSSGSCFPCGTANTFTVAKVVSATNDTCSCANGLTWNSNGYCACSSSLFIFDSQAGSCACDYTKAYGSNTACTACPAGTTGPDGSGGCVCPATNAWQGSACVSCKKIVNHVLLASNVCFVCGTAGTYTVAKVVNAANNSCTCSANLKWNSAGFCDCGTSSAMIITGNTYSCQKCSNAAAFTKAKATQTSCSCVSDKLTWNDATSACDCGNSPNTIIVGTKQAAKCFTCTPSIYMVGASANLTACVCVGQLIWNSATMTCGCTKSTLSIIDSGVNTKCVSCSSILYAQPVANSIAGCTCLGTGLFFNVSCGGSCTCPANNIILPSFTCMTCPPGSVQFSAYECFCPTGSIWSIGGTTCITCGSEGLSNSIPSGGTPFACACSSGYIWDVMTLSCISVSACSKVTASCMKCPSGSATTITAAAAKIGLAGGATVMALTNGAFTNYNQIKGFKCPCPTGYTWDAMRMRCYHSVLK
jgi:hypothetical protein